MDEATWYGYMILLWVAVYIATLSSLIGWYKYKYYIKCICTTLITKLRRRRSILARFARLSSS